MQSKKCHDKVANGKFKIKTTAAKMKQKKSIFRLKVEVQLKLKNLFEISGEFRFSFGHDYYILNIIIDAFKNNAFSIKIKTKIKKILWKYIFFWEIIKAKITNKNK